MLRYFRILGHLECASLLALLLIAMPLKYLLDLPQAVRIMGTIHGVLFLMFVYTSITLGRHLQWSVSRILTAWLIASIPLGPVIFDKRLFSDLADSTKKLRG